MNFACPAKINLTLEVLDRRDDGYHALRSVIVPLELADDLRVEPAAGFSFTCSDPTLEGEDNLVVKAARALDPLPRAAIALHKVIPTQAGLGGGSSDAAALLRAAMSGAFEHRYTRDWIGLARSLGSDVPFFLTDSGALVEGTGERVTAVGALPAWHVLIVKPPASVSTAAAYALLDRTSRPSRPRNASVSLEAVSALQRDDFETVERLLQNDFHDPIAESTPPVARAIEALHAAGARNALLAGSGSAVFTLARSAEEIAAIDSRLDLSPDYLRLRTAFAHGRSWRGGVALREAQGTP
ncbi:MAG TPA: 4-(cytidine 5'-diphospho)-2-C-methyl-D-erythritol kinase [Candidatus Baltobacteraceae bacterium]|nr:4-(cytidine 5'-diphospho)-2-C-methyl-D-erythritol kinase [Candidatus Baltobacteraceae bacterium]